MLKFAYSRWLSIDATRNISGRGRIYWDASAVGRSQSSAYKLAFHDALASPVVVVEMTGKLFFMPHTLSPPCII